MTFITTCLNCNCDVFLYDPRDYEYARLHPKGGIILDRSVGEDEDFWKMYSYEWLYPSPDQVTCAHCGLSVERVRLDPDYDWDATFVPFNIKLHPDDELKKIEY